MFDGHLFTTKHANSNSQEHNGTREDALVEVGSSLCLNLFLLRFSPFIPSIDNDNNSNNNEQLFTVEDVNNGGYLMSKIVWY